MLMVAETVAADWVRLRMSPRLALVTPPRLELLMKERPGWMRLCCWDRSLCTVPPDSGSTPVAGTSTTTTNTQHHHQTLLMLAALIAWIMEIWKYCDMISNVYIIILV